MSELVSNDWNQLWDTYAESASENPAQDYRRQLIFEALALPKGGTSARLLDIGSGQGDFSRDVKQLFPSVSLLGLELSQSGVDISQRKVAGAEFMQRDLMQPHEAPAQYRHWATHAVCAEMLEHVPEPEKVLRNIRQYLAPQARLVVTVPGGPMSAFDKHIGHYKHYRAGELRALLERSGFQVRSVWRAGFPFMNLYKLVVILRGKKLIRDVAAGESGGMSRMANLVMKVFSVLFRGNLRSSLLGWQLVAVAQPKGD